jgi:hypothetical protein
MYRSNAPPDTVCPNGAFVHNLVNKDTTDHNLYISYGSVFKRKIYCAEDGLDMRPCMRPEFAYATDHTIALLSACSSFQRILLLSTQDNLPVKGDYVPIYIGVSDSILFVQDYASGKDKFLIVDLDNEKRQNVFLAPAIDNVKNVKQRALDCGNIIGCIQNIQYKNGMLSVQYPTRSSEETKATMETKSIKVIWR